METQRIEISVKAVILAIGLAMLMAGANAYMGLYAGMTPSASIPAAVISMGILSAFKRHSILEDNIVQTAASAGESLAAGVIFTIPALLLMGYWETFNYWEVAKIAGVGGLIGVLFTVPLRRALIVEAKLTYPEGIATAAVLETGHGIGTGDKSEARKGIQLLGTASIVGAIMKIGQAGFQMWHKALEGAVTLGNSVFGMGLDLSPALVSVGYIVGRNIAILVFSGGLISWLFAIPIYTAIHGYEGIAIDAANDIWNSEIRYLGVGAMVVGGIWSLIKLIKPLIAGIKLSLAAYRSKVSTHDMPLEERDIPIHYVGIALLILVLPVFLLYRGVLPAGIASLMTVVMLVFGFFFSAVAAYMAGVVGSSNNPISGVTVATVLFSSVLLLALLGTGSTQGAAAAILVGAVVCNAAAIGGDNMQDLKTGHLLGATPWKQQIMQIVGTLSAAIVLGVVLDILHTAYTIGSADLAAPQATLMRSVAEGVFQGNLPWDMVIAGAIIGIIIIILDVIQEKRGADFRLPVLAVAVGIYLPISLSAPIFLGGMLAHVAARAGAGEATLRKGILLAAGLITGEAIMAFLVALPIFITKDKAWWPEITGFGFMGPLLLILVMAWFYVLLTGRGKSVEQE